MTECPHCGCNDCELIHAGMHLGTPYARYRCDHCKKTFHHGVVVDQKRIPHPVLKCPKCHGVNIEQKNTEHHGRQIIRRMACRECNHRFYTVAPESTQKDTVKRRR